jgi:hypothetical protein
MQIDGILIQKQYNFNNGDALLILNTEQLGLYKIYLVRDH